MKLGFIGAGNMATAIIQGILNKNKVPASAIFVSNQTYAKAQALATKTGIIACTSNTEVVRNADVIFLSVKPHIIADVLQETKEHIVGNKKIVVSIAAGVNIETLEKLTTQGTPIIRVMPNVNATVGEGAASICGNSACTREQIDFIIELFTSTGKAYELPEKQFSIFSAIAGASPAYAYLFIDALSRVAVKHGLPKGVATQIAAQAVFGSAKMVAESTDVPWALIDKVCSPGGTTVEGLLAMEEANFTTAVTKAIDAVVAKDKELMNGNKVS